MRGQLRMANFEGRGRTKIWRILMGLYEHMPLQTNSNQDTRLKVRIRTRSLPNTEHADYYIATFGDKQTMKAVEWKRSEGMNGKSS
jgi:hypothetical protein